jgi:hypothetical protein
VPSRPAGTGATRSRGSETRGALELITGFIAVPCSREQIEQFWSRRLCRQNAGT